MLDDKLAARRPWLLIAWWQSLIATLGSLYFSNVAGFAPCILCWWQRILMYPLVVILLVGIIARDRLVGRYARPLVWLGAAVALYHNFIYYQAMYLRLHPNSTITAVTCSANGPSCAARYIEWGGFITIPLLSLISFVLIGLWLRLDARSTRQS